MAKVVKELTESEAQRFADLIKGTTDGKIGRYNAAVQEEMEATIRARMPTVPVTEEPTPAMRILMEDP